MSFSLKPRTAVNRKAWQERHIIAKRNREADARQAWDTTAKYFQTWQVKTTEYESLASAKTYKTSMEAYEYPKLEEAKLKNLDDRRRNLRELLRTEDFQYELELKNKLAKERHRRPCSAMCHGPTEPSLLPKQVREKLDILPADRAVKPKSMKPVECSLRDSLEKPAKEEFREPVASPAVDVDSIILQIREAEVQTVVLKKQQKTLETSLLELKRRADLRASFKRTRIPESSGGRYVRPYKVQLQMRGRQTIECLEFDLVLVDLVAKFWKHVDDVVLRQQFLDDLQRIRKKMIVKLKKEQVHLEFVEGLYQEEAEQVWLRKVSEWQYDSMAGDSIVDKILRATESQLQGAMTVVLESLQRNIIARENLIRQLEVTKLPTSRQPPETVFTWVPNEDRRQADDPQTSSSSSSLRLPAIERLRL